MLNNLNSKCEDEFEKSRTYATILFNYSSVLGSLKRREEALMVISEGELYERMHRRLIDLPGLTYNKGFNFEKLGEKEKSLPYFILAYYGTRMFADYGHAPYLPIMKETIQEAFDLIAD